MNLSRLINWRTRRSQSPQTPWAPSDRPHKPAVLTLAGIWAWQAHATLETRDGCLGTLAYGEPTDPESMLLVEALLAGASIQVRVHETPPATGRVVGMSERVWQGVLATWTSAHEVLARLNHTIGEGPAWGRLPELPLGEGVLAVLAQRRPDRSLAEVFKAADVDPADVAMALSALCRLGVIDLGVAGERAVTPHRVQPPRVTEVPPTLSRPVGVETRDTVALTARLDALRSQDPWRALGLPRSANLDAINTACWALQDLHQPSPADPPAVLRTLARIRDQVDRTAALLIDEGMRHPFLARGDVEDSLGGQRLARFVGEPDRSDTEHYSGVLLH